MRSSAAACCPVSECRKVGVYREEHAEDGMVDVVNKHCARQGCNKLPRFGLAGSKVSIYISWEHPEDGMVDVVNERRRTARLQ